MPAPGAVRLEHSLLIVVMARNEVGLELRRHLEVCVAEAVHADQEPDVCRCHQGLGDDAGGHDREEDAGPAGDLARRPAAGSSDLLPVEEVSQREKQWLRKIVCREPRELG